MMLVLFMIDENYLRLSTCQDDFVDLKTFNLSLPSASIDGQNFSISSLTLAFGLVARGTDFPNCVPYEKTTYHTNSQLQNN